MNDESFAQSHSSTPDNAAITLHGLTRYFGRRKVVDHVTMHVPKGSVFALLGRNGSGKTTTIRMLLGLLEPTRGHCEILGCDSRRLTPELRGRIGYLAESHPVYKWMTVRECRDHQAQFYQTWNDRVYNAVVEHFRLDPRARAGMLSRGERAGLALALTLAPEPEVLILDDPALGLDPVARRWLLEAVVYATRASERTILFSSHLLDDVERVADHVAILDRSILRVVCSMETFRAQVRHFVLHYDRSKPPLQLPHIPGLLRVRRFGKELRLTIAAPNDAVLSGLGTMGATSLDETAIGFDDAVIGYLGDDGERSFSLDSLPDARELADVIAAGARS